MAITLAFDERLSGCVLCGGALERFSDPEIRGVQVHYEACTGCGLVQMNPRPTPAALDEYYVHAYRAEMGDEDAGHTSAGQEHRSSQQRAFVGTGWSRHLDVGCSSGVLLGLVGAATQVGVEPGDTHRAMAADAGIETFATIDDLLATDPQPFDLVTISHVLEHVADPTEFLASIRPLVAPGGRLMVEVPYLYRSIAYEVAHLFCFTKASLVAAAKAAGFEVDRLQLHATIQGGLGTGHNIAVLLVPAEPTAPQQRTHVVALMRAGRYAGFAPQRLYRWRRRQERKVIRNVRRLRRRIGR